MNTIRSVLEGMGYSIPSSSTYKQIELWKSWYKGYNKSFHDYLVYNGRQKIKRTRKSLRMAKKVCEDHANLILNEKVQISASDNAAQEYIKGTMQANNFRVQGNKLVERSFALGSGAFVEHSDGKGGVMIDYIRADMIYPLSWDGDTITECAFGSILKSGKSTMIYLNIHAIVDGNYVIYNKLVPEEDGALPISPDDTGLLPNGMAAAVHTGSPTPRFQIIGPNTANNIDLDSPLGISIYANSIDVLKTIDLIYDSYDNEFRLGKKRVLINGALTKVVVDPASGDQMPIFDDNDTEFYGLPEFEADKDPIHEINMELRADAHEKGLQRFLNILSDKCGLGNDRYIFERGTARTATEVISEKSDLYQNLKKNELTIEAALIGLCRAVAEIGGYISNFEVTVDFDDSIIEDKASKRTRMQLLVSQGKFPLWRYLKEYEGYDEKTAREIEAETKTTGETLNFSDSDMGV
ncbi:MAG: phage portal protein [Clostridia bacterium]|nr:phage portal protein [Clostridia bacterium]